VPHPNALLALALVLLLSACSSTVNDPRFPVRIHVVDTIPARHGAITTAYVAGPRDIVVARAHITERTIAHELAHLVQWQQYGFDWPVVWFMQVLTHGYENAPFEVEARALANDPWYLDWARELIASMP
jgi:hypothetical protein